MKTIRFILISLFTIGQWAVSAQTINEYRYQKSYHTYTDNTTSDFTDSSLKKSIHITISQDRKRCYFSDEYGNIRENGMYQNEWVANDLNEKDGVIGYSSIAMLLPGEHWILWATIDYTTIKFAGPDKNGYDKYDVYVLNRKNINPGSASRANTTLTPQAQPAEEDTDNEIKTLVETWPQFQGSDDIVAFQKWVVSQLPQNGKQGRVLISFVVEKNGTLSNFETLRSPDPSMAEEIFSILRKSPQWTPGKIHNKSVRTKRLIAILFKAPN